MPKSKLWPAGCKITVACTSGPETYELAGKVNKAFGCIFAGNQSPIWVAENILRSPRKPMVVGLTWVYDDNVVIVAYMRTPGEEPMAVVAGGIRYPDTITNWTECIDGECMTVISVCDSVELAYGPRQIASWLAGCCPGPSPEAAREAWYSELQGRAGQDEARASRRFPEAKQGPPEDWQI